MKKEKLYIVKPNENNCTWEINLDNLARNACIQVAEGCRAVYYINGAEYEDYRAGDCFEVNGKNSRKLGAESVVGVSHKQVFRILWGLGGVPYKDAGSGINTQVGMHGEFTFKVGDYAYLMNTLGKRTVTPDDIKEFLVAKLKEILFSIISGEIKGQNYVNVTALQTRISNKIGAFWEDELKKIGLVLETISLSEVKFDDDFLGRMYNGDYEVRKKENPIETFIREHEEKETIKKLESENELVCHVCGKKLSAGAKFCDRCGSPVAEEK